MGNEYHKESERKEVEALRQGKHFGSDPNKFLEGKKRGMKLRSGRYTLPPPWVEPMEEE
jgi:hypothetical protein